MTFELLKSSAADDQSSAGKSYRCYFIDGDDRIRTYEQIECGDDAQAALKAEQLLAASQFTAAEVWQGKRLVAKWSNTEAEGPRLQTNSESST